jgi:hypothetical protein
MFPEAMGKKAVGIAKPPLVPPTTGLVRLGRPVDSGLRKPSKKLAGEVVPYSIRVGEGDSKLRSPPPKARG